MVTKGSNAQMGGMLASPDCKWAEVCGQDRTMEQVKDSPLEPRGMISVSKTIPFKVEVSIVLKNEPACLVQHYIVVDFRGEKR